MALLGSELQTFPNSATVVLGVAYNGTRNPIDADQKSVPRYAGTPLYQRYVPPRQKVDSIRVFVEMPSNYETAALSALSIEWEPMERGVRLPDGKRG